MVGDSPQSTLGNLSPTNADAYLDDRAAKGFNTVWFNLLCDSYTFCNSNGTTYDGVPPFTSPASGGNPGNYNFGANAANANALYFSRMHAIVAHAEADGIEVMLDPIETGGCQSGGWITALENNGNGTTAPTTRDYQYGAYLGTEFGDLPNITWLSGNDFQCILTAADRNDALAVAEGIASTDPTALQTLESNECNGDGCEGSSSFASTSGAATGWSSVARINSAYTYSPTYAQDRLSYAQTPTAPMILGEANYEGETNSGTDGCNTVRNCRLQEWWTMTSGATGQLYGCNCTTHLTNANYPNGMDTTGVTQLGVQTSLLATVRWWTLVPDTGNNVVTAGIGSCPTTGSIASVTCVTTASDYNGSAGSATESMSYLPDPNTFASPVVNLAAFAGPVTARWYDPTNGSFRSILGSPFTNTGTQTFTPSSNNAAGSKDWVLVLQTG